MPEIGVLVLGVRNDEAKVELVGFALILFLIQDLYRETHIDEAGVKSKRSQLTTEVFVRYQVERDFFEEIIRHELIGCLVYELRASLDIKL